MRYDVIVIGGGHAGVEAVEAASKRVESVLLITGNIEFIGEMPCNPAVGGVAKGNLVREIDALGGVMGKITDAAGIQFRMLNKSKGVAVWGPRAQTDRYLYRQLAREHVEDLANVEILQDLVADLLVEEGVIKGVRTETGLEIIASAVVVTTGTFLNGLAHVGNNTIPCGRKGELPSTKLSASIQSLGIRAGRLKTGTPPRIDRMSIDYSYLEEQTGDNPSGHFSFSSTQNIENKAVCWTVKTVPETHKIILGNLDKSPLYGLGTIEGIGPRYCPSIEDKLMRFGERDGHLLHLEPEGLNRREMYLNGFSTSLPFDAQVEMVQSLPGFSSAKILKSAYAIEYDYFEPTQLKLSLESRTIAGLFFAGQINGTSGYEEAAAQGLLAGVNAGQYVRSEDALVVGRDEGYLGVLVDDLVTKGTKEPYRMFTSRAEYRLILRQDTADERLMPYGNAYGLVSDEHFQNRQEEWAKRESLKGSIRDLRISSEMWVEAGFEPLRESLSGDKVLKRPEITLALLEEKGMFPQGVACTELGVSAQADIKYEGFVQKQKLSIDRAKRLENMVLPATIAYDKIPGLLAESREKLSKVMPLTVGQASRISGVTPADVAVILVYLNVEKTDNVSRGTGGLHEL